ncbi:MAG: RHS repeat-associated core domain-containing protein [Terriglobia bacterium]|nr:RHS repeat-associated core domain-containing protein [Terriglobia bacterium]
MRSQFTYDGIYRLTNEAIASAPSGKNGTVAYGLDPVGNRLSENSSLPGLPSGSFGYNADDQLSTESYDPDGNVTAADGKTFSYDSENHLVAMNGGAVQMLYDGDGNRVAKSVSGVVTRYLVDDLNPTGYPQVVDELNGSGAVTRTYTYGLQRISQNQVISNTWTPSFYGYDGMGSVRQLTNSAGAVTDTYEYDAFGNSFTVSGTTLNNYLYRGEQYDPDLGLYYLRARYYNPLTGRFMSTDPNEGNTFDPKTLHKYLYAGGDPVNMKDPTGRGAMFEYALIAASVIQEVAPELPVIAEATCIMLRITDLVLTAVNEIDAMRGKEPEGPGDWDFFFQEAQRYCMRF